MSITWRAFKPDYSGPTWEALESARADFHGCDDYRHAVNYYTHETRRVVVMSAGSIGGDILDESNSAALEEMARAWIDDDRAKGDGSDVDFHASGPTIYVCVAPDEIDPELLAEIISAAESFADYPVLDDSDYSEREWKAWNEGLEWAVRDVPDEHREAVVEWVNDNRAGYAEPGYVADEWVVEAMRALKLTRRRVRLSPVHPWLGYLQVLARDADGELSWHPFQSVSLRR